MLGYIEFDGWRGAPYLAKEQRLGGTFLVLNMGRFATGPFARRCAAHSAQQMRKWGVRQAVFPVDFPHTEVFRQYGIRPVDPMPLRIALCPRYVRERLRELGIAEEKAVVAVAGDCVSDELERTVRDLVKLYRRILLAVPSRGEELAQRLRRECGAAPVAGASKEQLERADALVLFSPRPNLRQENPVLCTLYPGGDGRGQIPLRLGEKLAAETAPNCSGEQLAAALYRMGILPAGRFLGENTC